MKINSILCRLCGHIKVEEVYATKTYGGKYHICKEVICYRCGKQISFKMTDAMSRAELLKNKWFVVDNE
ncbi:hypothetical protein IX334_001925 [Bacteroides pyogenes]|nr:hypothetical protein [Bacteroides pyogenes]MBR8737701.1 hypothetical protein [Bacteroides pyogenes]MBR8753253.1 hypothetical protein [Bacteroides pyogenes]MBR8794675.1 hypothetical protein [Bacteroides pyogenes]